MALTDEQKEKIANWLIKHNVTPKCKECGSEKANIYEVTALLKVDDKSIDFGNIDDVQFTPVVRIICDNCYNIRLFAVAPMGIFDD